MELLFNKNYLWKKIVHIKPSKNKVWNTKIDAPITDIKYINVLFANFISTVNKNNTIDEIATQDSIATTIYQSKISPDFIYLNVKLIHNIEGIRISK